MVALVLQWRTVFRQPWGWGRWPEVLFGSASPSLRAALWERARGRGRDRKKEKQREGEWEWKAIVGKRVLVKNKQRTVKGYNKIIFLQALTASFFSEHYLLENQHLFIHRLCAHVSQNISCSLYLLGLHRGWLLALRGASRWAGNTGRPGSQCLVHLSDHHFWDELAVLCLVIANQLHRWTHNLGEESRWCIRKCVLSIDFNRFWFYISRLMLFNLGLPFVLGLCCVVFHLTAAI